MADGITYAFTSEQEAFRKSVRRFLEDKSPLSVVRQAIDSHNGYDRDVWALMAQQLGLQSTVIPAQFGGSGFSFVELGIVLEEMGSSLMCGPFFATVALAANVLLCSGDETAMSDFLPDLASGEKTATFAYIEQTGSPGLDSVQMKATREHTQWVLEGRKLFVLDGASADLILVTARTSTGLSLFAVDASVCGLTRRELPTLDLTRRQAEVCFERAPARLIGAEGQALDGLSHALDLASVALALEQVGGAERCLMSAVDYAKMRVQFGRPIGSFQAIKHKCADMFVSLESAKTAAYHAAHLAADDDPELSVAAPLAKAFCSEAFSAVAAENIHIHGGVGFTWEHDAQLYFRRAKASEVLLGSPSFHREVLAQRLGV